MILTCSECSTQFIIKPEDLGEKGRKVKCAQCKHVWFQEVLDENTQNTQNESSSNSISNFNPSPNANTESAVESKDVAKKQSEKTISVGDWLALAASIAIFVVSVSVFVAKDILPDFTRYYSFLNILDVEKVALYDIQTKIDEDNFNNKKTKFLTISGKIVNESNKSKIAPDVRVSFLDNDRKSIKTVLLKSEKEEILEGGNIEFANKIPDVPDLAKEVVVDLGDWLDFKSR